MSFFLLFPPSRWLVAFQNSLKIYVNPRAAGFYCFVFFPEQHLLWTASLQHFSNALCFPLHNNYSFKLLLTLLFPLHVSTRPRLYHSATHLNLSSPSRVSTSFHFIVLLFSSSLRSPPACSVFPPVPLFSFIVHLAQSPRTWPHREGAKRDGNWHGLTRHAHHPIGLLCLPRTPELGMGRQISCVRKGRQVSRVRKGSYTRM